MAISVENRKFFAPRIFNAAINGLEFGIDARGQNTGIMGLLGRERRSTISSAVWIQYTNVTDTGR